MCVRELLTIETQVTGSLAGITGHDAVQAAVVRQRGAAAASTMRRSARRRTAHVAGDVAKMRGRIKVASRIS